MNSMLIDVNNSSLTADNAQQFQFAYDSESGKYGYKAKVEGADTFFPFSGGLNIKNIYIPDATRPSVHFEIDCTNVSKISFIGADNTGGKYSRGLNVYTDRSCTSAIYTPLYMTGKQIVDVSSYDSVVIVISDYVGGQSLISDFELL